MNATISVATERTALVAGGSGLIGSRLLPLLLAAPEYGRVYALSRRPLPMEHARLANRVLRFDAPFEAQLKGLICHDAFCCLGTTLRAAGSQAAFRAVDQGLVVAFVRAALAAGAQRIVLVSSVGADPGSKNFYLRVKGETERAVEALRPRSLDILQPSVLLGVRRDWRAFELAVQLAMMPIGPLLLGEWARFRAIEAATVAAAMRGAARSARRGIYRYTFQELQRLATVGERPQV
jgi:uncharacterized protein YbjT (DUF2867 family)